MPKPSNILVLMCDHHRFDALSCLGNPLAYTPNLDALAARSVRFANCFNQSPVCAPARHSLATGRYCHAHGVTTNQDKPFPGMRTIAHAMQGLGYRRFNQGHMHWTDRSMDNGYEPWIDQEMWRQAMPADALARYDWENLTSTRLQALEQEMDMLMKNLAELAERQELGQEDAEAAGVRVMGWIQELETEIAVERNRQGMS